MDRKASGSASTTRASASASAMKGASASTRSGIGLFDPPEDHLKEIGRLLLLTGMIEGSVEMLIWRLAGMEPSLGRIFTTHLDLRRRLDRVQEISEIHPASSKILPLWVGNKGKKGMRGTPKVKGIRHRIDDVSNYRNLVHGIYLDRGAAPKMWGTRAPELGAIYSESEFEIGKTKDVVALAEQVLTELEQLHSLALRACLKIQPLEKEGYFLSNAIPLAPVRPLLTSGSGFRQSDPEQRNPANSIT